MIKLKEYFCKLVLAFLNFWIFLEKILIRLFLSSYVKEKIVNFYGLDAENKGLVVVKNEEFYIQAANKGFLGFGESYAKGWISIKNVDQVVKNVLRLKKYRHDFGFRYKAFLDWLKFEVFETRSSTDFYNQFDIREAMLGPGMNYSCGLWLRPEDDLEAAQRNKMELIARKLKLKPGMRVLDVGCGYGALAKHLAANHGVKVLGITNSHQTIEYARSFCNGVPDVQFRLADCKDLIELGEKFDRIVAVEVLFHIPKKNYKSFFSNMRMCLKKDGIFFLQVIGNDDPLCPAVNGLFNTFLPDARIPFISDVTAGFAGLFVLEEWTNIGAHYYKTQMAWNSNFCKTWENIAKSRGEEFCRLWSFNMQAYAGLSRARSSQIWHILLSKEGILGGLELLHDNFNKCTVKSKVL